MMAAFAGLAAVCAALAMIERAAPVAVGIVGAALFAAFCWGGWLGRVVALVAIAFLVAAYVCDGFYIG
jgi:hypothetical protein